MTTRQMELSPDNLERLAFFAHKTIERDPDTDRMTVVVEGVRYVAALDVTPLEAASERERMVRSLHSPAPDDYAPNPGAPHFTRIDGGAA